MGCLSRLIDTAIDTSADNSSSILGATNNNQNVFLATQKIEGLHSIVSLQHRQISALTGEISQLRKSIDEIEGKIETILNDLKYIKSLR
jgi:peptidoglycan hydrolase CwlO-like protein